MMLWRGHSQARRHCGHRPRAADHALIRSHLGQTIGCGGLNAPSNGNAADMGGHRNDRVDATDNHTKGQGGRLRSGVWP